MSRLHIALVVSLAIASFWLGWEWRDRSADLNVSRGETRQPMGGNAAVLTVQSAMTTLDSLGQASDANQARAAIRAFLGFQDEPQKD
jgi:hypothetical protein